MKRRVVLTTTRDFPILIFLWKWKVATTAIIAQVFFGRHDREMAYRRLMRLSTGGFVEMRTNSIGKCLGWTLTQRGYGVIKWDLPDLKEDGFRSEHLGHDLLVTIMHLGVWVVAAPKGAGVFTEQQLRRYEPESIPDWVPESAYHRPDGYWKLPRESTFRVVAVEVELNRKKNAEYGALAGYYEENKDIFRVLWLVKNHGMAKRLHGLFNEGHRSKFPCHNFISYANFQKNVWSARIEFGPEVGMSLAEMLISGASSEYLLMEQRWILDVQKSPHSSKSYRPLQIRDICK